MSDKVKVFVSWSKPLSKAVAEVLRDWIGDVIQASEPFLSAADIEPGETWGPRLNTELESTKVGIIVLTMENKEMPWILFEAGALAKGLGKNRVCPFLVNLEPSHVKQPLGQFQATKPERDDMFKLAQMLNRESGALDDKRLQRAFDANIEQFLTRFREVLERHQKAALKGPATAPKDKRSTDDMIAEVLENTRAILRREPELAEGAKVAEMTRLGTLRRLAEDFLRQRPGADVGNPQVRASFLEYVAYSKSPIPLTTKDEVLMALDVVAARP